MEEKLIQSDVWKPQRARKSVVIEPASDKRETPLQSVVIQSPTGNRKTSRMSVTIPPPTGKRKSSRKSVTILPSSGKRKISRKSVVIQPLTDENGLGLLKLKPEILEGPTMMTLAGQSLLRHIQNKDLLAVGNLVSNGTINLDERDEEGQTFLMVACQAETASRDIIKELLAHMDTDVNAVDNDNWTALLNAAKYGHTEVVSDLLDVNADIEHRDMGGWTALMWGAYKGRTDVVRELLGRGANPNVKGEHHISCLTWAAGRGYTEIVRLLVDNGAKVNTADKYGTTPLIWAARKGHKEIVEILLEEGATVDNAGMNSWTALILAAKGGYAEVSDAIIDCNPNLNSVDKDGYTALTLAAKDGYLHIVNALLRKGAYVNLPDRYGDTILIHAVKGGHLEVVNSLLKKYVDVNVQGVDNKTALYWSVEKGHVSVAKALLDHHADCEIANKDGDTPLLKAVRSRSLDLVQMLLGRGAKVHVLDKHGDTALHISVRGRSKRITEQLLRNPKDSRLLYKPNKGGETPYQIDTTHQRSILTQIFGTRDLNAEESISGYDLYSSTIADVLSDPSLRTPITVGLYAKWGSGKSSLIGRLQKEMQSFTQHNVDSDFEFTVLQFFLSFLSSLLLGLLLAYTLSWPWGVGFGCGLLLLQYLFLGVIWFGSTIRDWRWAEKVGCYLARRLMFLQLLLQVNFCNEPKQVNKETAAVKFLFTKNARLASVVGEKSITAMIAALCDALEDEYGVMVTRLYRVIKPGKASEYGRFKKLCCIPYFVIVIFVVLCFVVGLCLFLVFRAKNLTEPGYTVIDSVLITLAIIVGLTILGHVYKWAHMMLNLVISPKRRINKISQQLNSLKIEGVMQNLKKEVEMIGNLTRCADAFLNTSTRLVVIVDGLDSCEQEKLLQVLDTVHMLFGDVGSPFITILAVDPHVVIKGIEHNIHGHGLFQDSSINGHDYLRNIVHLPFFLQSQAMPPPPRSMYSREREESICEANHSGHGFAKYSTKADRLKIQTEKASSGSVVSLNKLKKEKRSKSHSVSREENLGGSMLVHAPSNFDLTKTFTKNSYFSDINPKNLRRLKNIVAVTGRLLRAYHIEFNWYRLASWINITEQWPYRLSWIIQDIEDKPEQADNTTLKAVFDRVSASIPVSKEIDPLLEIDRNVRKLEIFLANHKPPLSVGDLRKFLPCTINVDPYLRKLIREMQHNEMLMSEMSQSNLLMPPNSGLQLPAARSSGRKISTLETIASMAQFPDAAALAAMSASPSQIPVSPGGPMSQRGSAERFSVASPQPTTSQQAVGSTPMMMMSQQALLQQQALAQQQAMLPYGGALYPGMLQQQQMLGMPPGGMMQPQSLPLIPPPPRTNVRVALQGGSPDVPLSQMTVEDICQLIGRLPSISKSNLSRYTSTLRQQNISGLVLINCELTELKAEMGMSFGDWELFRNLVDSLRTKETMTFYGVAPNSQTSNMSSTGTASVPAEANQHPSLAGTMSAPVMKVSQNAPRPEASTSSNGISTQGKGRRPSGNGLLKKRDSLVGLLMYETQALREAMGNLEGGSSDSEGSGDEGITFDPEGSLEEVDEEEEEVATGEDAGNTLVSVAITTSSTQNLPTAASVPVKPTAERPTDVPGILSGPAIPAMGAAADNVMLTPSTEIGDGTSPVSPPTLGDLQAAEQGECSSSINSLDDILMSQAGMDQLHKASLGEDTGPSAFKPIAPAAPSHTTYDIQQETPRIQAHGATHKAGTGASGQGASPPLPEVTVVPDAVTNVTPDEGAQGATAKEVIVNVEGKTVKVSLSRDESFI